MHTMTKPHKNNDTYTRASNALPLTMYYHRANMPCNHICSIHHSQPMLRRLLLTMIRFTSAMTILTWLVSVAHVWWV